MLLSRRHFLALVAAVSSKAFAEPCCGTLSPAAAKLVAFIDATMVDRLGVTGFDVNWRTGVTVGTLDRRVPHTHCSAYVASVAERLGVYVMRPPDHSAASLANAQMGWLESGLATAHGWRHLADVVEAQILANRGQLVLAAYRNKYPERPGHIAARRKARRIPGQRSGGVVGGFGH
jgi:hypothetical protein